MGITVHDARYTIQSGMKDSDLKKPSRPRRRALGVATATISVLITLLALQVVARILMPGPRALENIVTQNSARYWTVKRPLLDGWECPGLKFSPPVPSV